MQFKFFSLMIILLALVFPVGAHHSHGNYDVSTWTEIEGTVAEVHWINPHAWIYLEVEDDQGESSIWTLEATGPTGLEAKGIQRNHVMPNDPIHVRCHLHRDGSNGCLLGFVTPRHGDPERGAGIEVEWD